jgi:hypothetical protein
MRPGSLCCAEWRRESGRAITERCRKHATPRTAELYDEIFVGAETKGLCLPDDVLETWSPLVLPSMERFPPAQLRPSG